MFQDLALFPHLNVFDNISFGLRMHGWGTEESRDRVRDLADLVRIGHLLQRRIDELSGGEQQRVALARSLAPQPSVLMLDEPLGSLDRTLRDDLVGEIRGILRSEGVTAVYVTHDQEEAFTIADRVVVVSKGKFAQVGTPVEVFYEPASPFVARFLGHRNLIEATAGSVRDGVMTVETALGRWEVPAAGASLSADGVFKTLLVPIDAVSVRVDAGPGALSVSVEDAVMRAGRYVTSVQVADSGIALTGIAAAVARGWAPTHGDRAWATIDLEMVRTLSWREG